MTDHDITASEIIDRARNGEPLRFVGDEIDGKTTVIGRRLHLGSQLLDLDDPATCDAVLEAMNSFDEGTEEDCGVCVYRLLETA